jgi:hypothetical protein
MMALSRIATTLGAPFTAEEFFSAVPMSGGRQSTMLNFNSILPCCS